LIIYLDTHQDSEGKQQIFFDVKGQNKWLRFSSVHPAANWLGNIEKKLVRLRSRINRFFLTVSLLRIFYEANSSLNSFNITFMQSTTKEDGEEIPVLINGKENDQYIFSKKSNNHIIHNLAGQLSGTV